LEDVLTGWQDHLGNWRHEEPIDPDPERRKKVIAHLMFEWQQLKKPWGLGESSKVEQLEHVEPLPPVKGPTPPSSIINSSFEILLEVDQILGMEWYDTLTRTIAPWGVFSTTAELPKLAYWVSPSGLYLHDQAPQNLIKILVEKRVLWHQHIKGHREGEAWQLTAKEFDTLSFGVKPRNCDLCETEFRVFGNLIEFAQTNPWQILHNRKFCSQACRRESKWQDSVRKGMNPDAAFDKTITRDAVWKRFGPRCYLCGKEAFYNQPDLVLRNKSKAWRARWGDVDKYDETRNAVVEHVVPRSKGGSHTWENVRIACSGCNLDKGDVILAIEKIVDEFDEE
jgi:5-methylcytosine-specific restriction endonuclease McrA